MFTGLIEEVGTIESVRKGPNSAVITVKANKVLSDLKIGDSVCLNGVCLTATDITGHGYSVDVMHETLNRSNLGALQGGSRVNLERAMPADGRFGGHIVAGHIDGTGRILSMRKDDNAVWITVSAKPEVLKYIIEKGSIAIDGISLTVAEVTDSDFSVSVIPHTASNTTLLEKKAGDSVNLETDMIGKYVEKMLAYGVVPGQGAKAPGKTTGITMEFLAENGF